MPKQEPLRSAPLPSERTPLDAKAFGKILQDGQDLARRRNYLVQVRPVTRPAHNREGRGEVWTWRILNHDSALIASSGSVTYQTRGSAEFNAWAWCVNRNDGWEPARGAADYVVPPTTTEVDRATE